MSRKTVWLFVLILMVGGVVRGGKSGSTDPPDVAKEWKGVMASQPRVAAAVLESYETLVEAGLRDEPVVCLTEDQVKKLRDALCRLGIVDCRPTPSSACPTCKHLPPTVDPNDGQYLQCLAKRIQCLGGR